MTSKRRHPAQASRILATGLSAATLLGIVAVLGAQPPVGPPDDPAGVAPARVTVVIGDRPTNSPGRHGDGPAGTPDTAHQHPPQLTHEDHDRIQTQDLGPPHLASTVPG